MLVNVTVMRTAEYQLRVEAGSVEEAQRKAEKLVKNGQANEARVKHDAHAVWASEKSWPGMPNYVLITEEPLPSVRELALEAAEANGMLVPLPKKEA
jgi:hypothetical protein